MSVQDQNVSGTFYTSVNHRNASFLW